MKSDLLKHIDRLIQERPVSKDALTSYRELINLMGEVEPKPLGISIDDKITDIKKDEGFPLFSGDALPLDFEASSEVLKRFLDHLSGTKREDAKGLKKALKKSNKDADWIGKLFKTVLNRDAKALSKMGKEVDLDPKVLQFLAQVALRPSLNALRNEAADKIEKKGWDYGYCPLCGSQPNMAYFDERGKRHLHCELCGEEWPHPRVNCPFCQNEEQKSMGYFQSEQEEGFRVDICRKCKRYIKTIDKRIVEDAAPMELEFLATIHLDLLANKHGFR
jgi:FdhE protein